MNEEALHKTEQTPKKSMKRKFLIIAAIVIAIIVGAFFSLPIIIREVVMKPAQMEWRRNAISLIEEIFNDPAKMEEERKNMQSGMGGDDSFLAEHLILMQNGEWIVYSAECHKKDRRIRDIFIGKASDGKWYYTNYHFCIGMINLMSQPETFADFTNEYSVCEFDGDPKNTFGDTWRTNPPVPPPPRVGIYQADLKPGSPNLGALKRAATAVANTIPDKDPALKGHKLTFHAIRYEHRFFAWRNHPVGVKYIAIYCDNTLSGGDATGVDIEVSNGTAHFKSTKGDTIISYPLDGELSVPEEMIEKIAKSALAEFLPEKEKNSLLTIEEIVCCDPSYSNDYHLTFRMPNLYKAESYNKIDVYVSADGLVRESKIEIARGL